MWRRARRSAQRCYRKEDIENIHERLQGDIVRQDIIECNDVTLVVQTSREHCEDMHIDREQNLIYYGNGFRDITGNVTRPHGIFYLTAGN